ncbi:MAG TPA: hypothetical protein VGD45_00910 [Steroidobacter sp.]|uniref:hypothetical protein n=1 Tax=Steroidobacter sp. TaxID=1978227 RepID=UPI002EDA375B
MSKLIRNTLCVAALGTGLSLAYFAFATAPGDGEEPPPPTLNDCSPGFWKTHTEIWFGTDACGAACDDLLSDLASRGPGSDAQRHDAAATLNAWADLQGIDYCPNE